MSLLLAPNKVHSWQEILVISRNQTRKLLLKIGDKTFKACITVPLDKKHLASTLIQSCFSNNKKSAFLIKDDSGTMLTIYREVEENDANTKSPPTPSPFADATSSKSEIIRQKSEVSDPELIQNTRTNENNSQTEKLLTNDFKLLTSKRRRWWRRWFGEDNRERGETLNNNFIGAKYRGADY